ncbi:hypothetical protein ACFLT8_04920 [Chloroflexota bacterium]
MIERYIQKFTAKINELGARKKVDLVYYRSDAMWVNVRQTITLVAVLALLSFLPAWYLKKYTDSSVSCWL